MSKHTPGPWEIDPEGNVIVKGDANATIAWVSSPDSYENGDEPMMANARLIAAAPELLDALYAALQGHKGWDDEARAAIAKAEGASESS